MKYHLPNAVVIEQVRTDNKIYALTFLAPEIAREAQPGQFVHVKTGDTYDPLLRRPLSICKVSPEMGEVTLWYQVVGKGTELLSRLREGDLLDVIGPLGRGFDTDIQAEKIFLVGGGIGIAPLIFLQDRLKKNNQTEAFFGGKNRKMLQGLSLLSSEGYKAATEDGSSGYKGFVTDLVQQAMQEEKPARIYTCGPTQMMEKVIILARNAGIPLQISLEAVMACGVGTCLGCTCRDAGKKDDSWVKVCKDGPVFWEQEVSLP